MKLMTLNIKGCQTQRILNYVTSIDVDIMVLTEYRILKSGDKLQPTLAKAGWEYLCSSNPGANERGVLIASRDPVVQKPLRTPFLFHYLAPYLDYRVVEIYVPEKQLLIVGVYVPYYDGEEKDTLWSSLIQYAQQHSGEPYVITGDFNSCTERDTEGSSIYTSQPLHAIKRLTVDAWEFHNEGSNPPTRDRYTWYSKNSGIRLDYTFLSPVLRSALQEVEHIHSVREKKVSDHSAVLVTLNL